VVRGLRRREGLQRVRQLAPGRDGRRVPRLPRRHQGPPHDADRRRHPLAERRASSAPRPLHVSAPGALVRGRALAGEDAERGRHGDLPREHGGHLRRHRVRGGLARGRGLQGLVEGDQPEGLREDPFPRHRGHRRQAGLARRHRAPRPRRHRVRHRPEAQERHARAQGQHHEVHGRCLPELGLRARGEGIRGPDLHLGSVGAHQGRQGRGSRQRRAGRGAEGRQDPHQGRHRGHRAPAGAHAPERVRRHRDAEPQRRLPLGRTSTTSPATRSSRRPTAPRRSTPTRTSSIRPP